MLAALWERLDGKPAALSLDGLSPEERSRAGAFGNERRLAQYLAGRRLLRQAAAALLDVDAAGLVLNAEGQPRCLNSPRPLWLSLSHSGPFVVAAASDEGPVGVDVEQREQSRDWAALAVGLGWSGADEAEGFLLRWTLKEAHFKAGLEHARYAWQAVDALAVISLVSVGAAEPRWLPTDRPNPFRRHACAAI
jgi:phosphopantetheinyl transferase